MNFEPIKPVDLNAIADLQPDDWNDIIPSISYYIRSGFCYPVKVTIGEKIVGIGALIVLGDTSWLAHIIVQPEYRNRGIGLKIVEYLLEYPNARSSHSFLLIATKLGEPIYKKTGFRTVTEYVFFDRKQEWSHQPVSQKIISFSELHRAQLIELDKRITGENRQRILNEHLPKSKVYANGNKILGYFLPDFFNGLIVADTAEAGIELMKLKYAAIDNAVLPVENISGIHFLKQNGFIESSRAFRMILGEDLKWQPAKIYSRIGGNLG